VEESPKKFYVAYKVTQNFVCMEVQKNKVVLYLKLNPAELQPLPQNLRDVRDIGHYGTGDLEVTIKSTAEIDIAKTFVKLAYERVGG
jgi:predicted transport protein